MSNIKRSSSENNINYLSSIIKRMEKRSFSENDISEISGKEGIIQKILEKLLQVCKDISILTLLEKKRGDLFCFCSEYGDDKALAAIHCKYEKILEKDDIQRSFEKAVTTNNIVNAKYFIDNDKKESYLNSKLELEVRDGNITVPDLLKTIFIDKEEKELNLNSL